jgi:hypothetical protein
MARCAGIKRDGGRCTAIVGGAQTYCYQHDPARAQERSRNASKAAKSKPSRELRAVKDQLRNLADQVLAGEVEQNRAGVASRILGVFLRAVEQERKIIEQEEVLERIEALEQRTGGSRPWR